MNVIVDDPAGTVRKRADSESDRQRLAGEAAVLRVAAHPGVVQILATEGGGDPDALVLRKVAGRTLHERADLGPQELARIGAALATTLADLHDIGVVHLALDASHVLIDESDRPVLCGFGSSRYAPGAERLESWRRADVAALARLLNDSAAELPGARVGSALRAAASGRRRGIRGKPIDARTIARTLAAAASSDTAADHGGEHPGRRTTHRHGRRVRLAIGASTIAGGLALAGALLPAGAGRSATQSEPRQHALTTAAGGCPTQDEGCIPVAEDGGAVGLGYRISGATGVVVIGRWDCLVTATPAILDPTTGRLWVFDSWPRSGEQTTARLVAVDPGGSSLRVIPQTHSPCDLIEVDRRGEDALLADPIKPIDRRQ